jgi:nucleoside 2-deoxyribosyltransferase
MKRVYVIGSLRNPLVPDVANYLRAEGGLEVFDDWFAAGPRADDHWKEYEQQRGRTFIEALAGKAAQNVFAFDRRNLDRSDAAVLVLPAGRSGHLELGYMAGRGLETHILLAPESEGDRWDVMYAFVTGVHKTQDSLAWALKA